MFLFAALLDATTHFGKAFCTLVLEEVYFSIQEMIVQMYVWIGGNLSSMVSLLGFMLHMLKSQPWCVCAYRTRMPPARSFSFIVAHHWPHAMFALIYCLLRKTCDYSPTTTTYKKKLLCLKWYKSRNWTCFAALRGGASVWDIADPCEFC